MITLEEKVTKLEKKLNVLVEFITDYIELADKREDRYRDVIDNIVNLLYNFKEEKGGVDV